MAANQSATTHPHPPSSHPLLAPLSPPNTTTHTHSQGTRYDDSIAVFGRSLQDKMAGLKMFLVRAGCWRWWLVVEGAAVVLWFVGCLIVGGGVVGAMMGAGCWQWHWAKWCCGECSMQGWVLAAGCSVGDCGLAPHQDQ